MLILFAATTSLSLILLVHAVCQCMEHVMQGIQISYEQPDKNLLGEFKRVFKVIFFSI